VLRGFAGFFLHLYAREKNLCVLCVWKGPKQTPQNPAKPRNRCFQGQGVSGVAGGAGRPLQASLGVQGRQAQHSPRGEAVASRPAATLALPAGRKQILQAV